MILDRAEATRLVLGLDKWAWEIAHRFHRKTRRGDIEDYHAAAVMGMWEAATTFDPARGVRFVTFATWHARNRVRQHARGEAARGQHVPHEHGFVKSRVGSLDAAARDDDLRFDPPAPAEPEQPGDSRVFWRSVDGQLPAPRDRLLTWLYYRCGWPDNDVARVLGVTRARVHQMRTAVLAYLRRRGDRLATEEVLP